jgi:FAD/FMN-containing dehydrogenase/Fe-S oxidoreductase
MDARGLIEMLRATAAGEVRDDPATRELYATDASLYRRLPAAALRAADPADLPAAVSACREHGMPITMRGAGTSLAGQAVGPGLVVDTSGLRAVSIDPDARTARIEPGVVLDQLNTAAAAYGLTFGPDVATANRATLGGMISNNSAGARSIAYGLTADHVVALDVVLADGATATLRRGAAPPAALEACRELARHARPPRLLRRVSGYNLDALAGDAPDWPRVLCGAEGTLGVITSATVRLVERPESRGLALAAYRTVDEALEAVTGVLPAGPSAVELLDRAMLDARNRAPATAELVAFAGDAQAMLVIEYQGPPDEVAERLAAHRGAMLVSDPAEQAAVWAVRRSGIARALGLGSGDAKPLAFIEDPAVPPENLAHFARGVRALLEREGMPAIWYGHASVGCLHIRPLLDLREAGAVARMRTVAEGVADMVAANGGSLSGEHGDGRLRGELLPRMYPPETIRAFAELKHRLDPDALLNPGIIVDPEPFDAHLRIPGSPPLAARHTAVSFAREGGLGRAAESCNGNAACRKPDGLMCPSYQATGDERHSTRGRANLVRAAIEGRLPGGLADEGLHEALELCLGCKACKSECPAQVDMARIKVEALAHRHREGGVPLRARFLGHAHDLLALGSRTPALAAAAVAAARLATGRDLPAPTRAWRPRTSRTDGDDVVLMADTFTRFLHPEIGDAAIRVLEATGARVVVVDPGCCGRPLLSQGLVAAARARVTGALDALTGHVRAGRPIVVLEPSCWSMLVDDAATVVDDPRAALVAGACLTFERAVLERGLPALGGGPDRRVVVHPHCHTRALGGGGDATELVRMIPDADADESAPGCCGMAGAFGYTHPAISRRIASRSLLPAAAGADLAVAAGTSCRHQIGRLAGIPAVHPAQLLAAALPG